MHLLLSWSILNKASAQSSCLKQPRPLLRKQKGREDTSQIEKEKRETESILTVGGKM
jgi:hypothetical protein